MIQKILTREWIGNARFYLISALFFAVTAILIPFLIQEKTIRTTPLIFGSLLAFPMVIRFTKQLEFEDEVNSLFYKFTTVISWIVVGVVTFVLGIFFVPTMLLFPQTRFKLMFIGSAVIIYCLGVRVTYNGSLPKNQGPYIICPNHTSFLDYFLSTYIMGWKGTYTVVHGANLHGIPIIGNVMRKWLISVDRANSKTYFSMMTQMREALSLGMNVLIYPEGGRITERERNNGIQMRLLKPGAFNMAHDLEVSIVPVTINGAFNFKPKESKRWYLVPGAVQITFHDPIRPDGTLPDQLGKLTKEAILSALE